MPRKSSVNDTRNGPARCIAYVRVSSQGQEDNASLPTQEAACHAYADDHGYRLVAVHSDVHTGAVYRERRGLSTLREQVRAGAIDVVLAYAVDRLSRNQAHLAILVEEFEVHGARLEFVTEDFEDSAVGKFIRSAKSFASEIEREKIAERTTRGRIARAQKGKLIPGSRPLYGYRWRDKEKGQLVADPATAPIVRRLFESIASGMSLHRLAASLKADGIPTPTGKGHWYASTLSTILHNPAYRGEAYAWGIRKAGARPQHFDPEKAILLPDGTIPALVDDLTWHAVQAVLKRNKAQSIRSAKNPEAALLRGGYVLCGTCGRKMRARPRSNGGIDYYCGQSQGLPCPRPTSIVGSIVDPAVWSRVRAVIVDPSTVAREVERLREKDPTADDLRAIDSRLATLNRQQANLTNAIAMLDDPDAMAPLTAQLRMLAEQKRSLNAEHEALTQKQEAWQSTSLDVEALAAWCATVAERVDALTWEERRMALSALGTTVTIYPPDHEPRFVINADVHLQSLSTTT